MNYKFSSKAGGYFIEVKATFIGDDLLVTCTGGDKPHIGAVAVAHPQTNLGDPEKPGVAANIICLSGHREDEIARAASLKICQVLGCTVTVVAGMHWHVIDRTGIAQVVANVEKLIEKLLVALAEESGAVDA